MDDVVVEQMQQSLCHIVRDMNNLPLGHLFLACWMEGHELRQRELSSRHQSNEGTLNCPILRADVRCLRQCVPIDFAHLQYTAKKRKRKHNHHKRNRKKTHVLLQNTMYDWKATDQEMQMQRRLHRKWEKTSGRQKAGAERKKTRERERKTCRQDMHLNIPNWREWASNCDVEQVHLLAEREWKILPRTCPAMKMGSK